MQSGNPAARRLKVIVESDPGGLVRVLQLFQARNITPLHVTAERLGAEFLQIDIRIAAGELPADALAIIVAKVNELPISMCAVVCD